MYSSETLITTFQTQSRNSEDRNIDVLITVTEVR
jgi:hypothetical protein